jgi:hypothetical protein
MTDFARFDGFVGPVQPKEESVQPIAQALEKDRTSINKVLEQMKNDVSTKVTEIVQLFDIQSVLFDLGNKAMQAYWDGWLSIWSQFEDWIRSSIAEVNNLMDPTVRHSPSMVDRVHFGVNKVLDEFGRLKDISSPLSNLSASLIPNNIPGIIPVSNISKSSSSVIQDQRSLVMNVKTSLDVNELNRKVSNHFRNVSRQNGGV